ncbi:MAG TPA: hypothetical protein VIK33_10640 [Anaerolineae bacterium]
MNEAECERLGKILYERMEHLDPSGSGPEMTPWESMSDHDREFYRAAAEAVAVAVSASKQNVEPA